MGLKWWACLIRLSLFGEGPAWVHYLSRIRWLLLMEGKPIRGRARSVGVVSAWCRPRKLISNHILLHRIKLHVYDDVELVKDYSCVSVCSRV